MANRYWVGGTGTWDTTTTTHWSASSGGTGGASVPTSADSVFFDGASASGVYTVTLTGGLSCLNLNIAKPTGGTLATTSTGTIAIAGSLIASGTGVTWGGTGAWTFGATTAQTLTSGGLTVPAINFNGSGGTWQMQDNLTSAGAVTQNFGTFDLNGFTLTAVSFGSTNTNTRTISFGTGSMSLSGSGTTVFSAGTITGLTVSGTPVVNLTYSGSVGTRTISVVSTLPEAQCITFNITAGSDIVNAATAFKDLNFTGFSGTLTNGLRTVYGNFILSPSMTTSAGVSATSFSATTTGTKTLDTGNILTDFPITVNSANITVQLGNNFRMDTANASLKTFTFTGGNLLLNNQTITAGTFTTTSPTTRNLNFGTSGVINIFGSGATVWAGTNATGFSYSGTANVNFTYSGNVGTRTITHGTTGSAYATRAPSFNITAGTDTVATTATSSLGDVNFTGFAGTLTNTARIFYGNVVFTSGMTATAGASVTTFAAPANVTQTLDSGNNTLLDFPFQMTQPGTVQLVGNNYTSGNSRTFTLSGGTWDLNNLQLSVGLVSASGSTTRGFSFGTTGAINVTGSNATVWTTATSSNLTISGSPTLNFTYSGSTGTRTISQFGSASTAFNTNITAGSDAISINSTRDLNFTGFSGTWTTTGTSIFGNAVLSTTMVPLTGTLVSSFVGNTPATITTNGMTWTPPINFSATGGNWTFADDFTGGGTITLVNGTLNASGNVTITYFVSTSTTNTRNLNMGSKTWTLKSAGGTTPWNLAAGNLTVSGANSTIVLANASSSAASFSGADATYGNLTIAGGSATGNVTVSGNNTFNTISSSRTSSWKLQFTATTTTTMQNFTVSGSSGNLVTISSPTASQHFLVLTGGGNINTVNYLNISHSNASPANTWYPGGNSINSGDNYGWMFPVSTGSSNFFLLL